MRALTRLKNGWFRAALPDQSPHPSSPSRIEATAAMVVVAAYATLQIALSVGHVPWLDEAQAWILATTAAGPLDLLILPNEGHPPLWYWIIRALSTVLTFEQARFFTVTVAILNGVLLHRLLRGELILLALTLFSFAVLQHWGYHFRPYSLILTCIVSALLLDRADRPIAATWSMALACALHFFSGLLFAFWLVWQLKRGTNWTRMVAPAAFAALFGLLAVLSSMGNVTAGPASDNLLLDIAYNLSWPLMAEQLRGPLAAILILGLILVSMLNKPMLATALMALLVGFAAATALIYGRSPWHASFMTMLCLIAVMVAGVTPIRRWMLVLILIPQVVFGLQAVAARLAAPNWTNDNLYESVAQDAGESFDPEQNLVGWPDFAIPEWAARNGIRMINGNSGQIASSVNWQTHNPTAFADTLLERPRPYWLICYACDLVIAHLEGGGATVTRLGVSSSVDNGESASYRID